MTVTVWPSIPYPPLVGNTVSTVAPVSYVNSAPTSEKSAPSFRLTSTVTTPVDIHAGAVHAAAVDDTNVAVLTTSPPNRHDIPSAANPLPYMFIDTPPLTRPFTGHT